MSILKRRIGALCTCLAFVLLAYAGYSQSRTVTLDTGTQVGLTNVIRVLLNAQGNENAVGFSLSFDSQLMQFVGATIGSGAPGASMNVNSSHATNGIVGVALAMSFGQKFAAGLQECARLSFVPIASGNSSLNFTDSPVVREVSDDAANVLSATFVNSNISVVYISPPGVATQPASQTMVIGSNVTFSVVASGTPPFGYQWRKDSANISGATTSMYTRPTISTSDVGSYSVVVTNLAGVVTSANATLSVIIPGPVQLTSVTANPDSTMALSWSCTVGVPYVLQYKSNLLDVQWTFLNNYLASSSSLTVSDSPGAVSQRFYRLAWSTGASSAACFIKVPLLANSDTYVSIPFSRTAVALTTISSLSGNTISVNGSPNWTPNQFVYAAGVQTNTFYARFTSGALEGHTYQITNNGPSALSVDLGGDSLAGGAANDGITIEPCWTIGAVFPSGSGINISPTLGNRNTEILIPDLSGTGINLSSSKIYFFHNGLWKVVGQGNADHSNDALQPGSHFIVRHNVATNTTWVANGSVLAQKVAVPFRAYAVTKQDNAVGLARPVAVTLDGSQLVSSGAFASSPLPGSRTDELIVFDNTVVQHNKSAAAVYYYWGSGWRRVGAGSTLVGGDTVFTPGAAVVVRKNTNTVNSLWLNSPSY